MNTEADGAPVTTKQIFSECAREFRLAYSGRAYEQEHTQRASP